MLTLTAGEVKATSSRQAEDTLAAGTRCGAQWLQEHPVHPTLRMVLTPEARRETWCCCVCTKALVAQQVSAVMVHLVLLLPQHELLAGKTLMLRRPLQTHRDARSGSGSQWVTIRSVWDAQVIGTGCRCSSYSWDSPSSAAQLHGAPRRSTETHPGTHSYKTRPSGGARTCPDV